MGAQLSSLIKTCEYGKFSFCPGGKDGFYFYFFFNMCLTTLICLNGNGFCLEADGGAEQLNQPSAKTLKIKVKTLKIKVKGSVR